jgi:excisionase family DNA binding protein
MNKLLSIEKAAQVLSVSPWTVRAWITQGKLGSAKLGTRRLVPESEIERLIIESSVPARRVECEDPRGELESRAVPVDDAARDSER